MKECVNCKRMFDDTAFFCDRCGTKLEAVQPVPQAEAPAVVSPQPQASGKEKSRGDFVTAPTGINVMSIIGFVLAFLCVAFVWIAELSIIVFPVAIIALVLCSIVKAMHYQNIFAKVGFIVALVVTIIAAIVFGIYFYETVF